MSLFHMYCDHKELLKKGNELVEKFEDLSKELTSKGRNYSLAMQKVCSIEDYLDKHFWHEEHIQVSHHYQGISDHIVNHMGIQSAFKNFKTSIEVDGITSDQVEIFEKKIMLPYLEHFNKEDKRFIDYLNDNNKHSLI